MKRLISFAAAAAVLFAAAPKTPSYAAETPAGASCVVYKVEKDHISIDGIGKDFRNGDLVIPEKIDGLNVDGAQAFIDWMLSDEASEMIAKYGQEQYGVSLFYLLEA